MQRPAASSGDCRQGKNKEEAVGIYVECTLCLSDSLSLSAHNCACLGYSVPCSG